MLMNHCKITTNCLDNIAEPAAISSSLSSIVLSKC